MHLVLLTSGQGGNLSVQHIHHHAGQEPGQMQRWVNLLVLDARHMSAECLAAACRTVPEIRHRHGLRHGVLVCQQPTLPLIITSIRCGLRDVITQYVTASHLRQILRASAPGIGRREYRDLAGFLRSFAGFSAHHHSAAAIARREEELARRAEELAEQQKALAQETESISRRDKDLKERTRRLDRQLARFQNDGDVMTGSSGSPFAGSAPPFTELDAKARQLEQRAAELDLREKLLNEMQTLLLSTADGTALRPQR